MKIYAAPDLVVRPIFDTPNFEIAFGSGDSRKFFRELDPVLVASLLTLSGEEEEEVTQSIAQKMRITYSEASETVELLLAQGILTTKVQDLRSFSKWEQNGWRDALDFHLATQNLTFNSDYTAYQDAMKAQLNDVAEGTDMDSPGPFSNFENSRIGLVPLLPLSNAINAPTFSEVIVNSRPFRTYANGSMSLQQLSDILHSTYAARSLHGGLLGAYYKRSSPSGGARNPIEVYVGVNDVEGVEKGIYHYRADTQSLEFLRQGNFQEQLTNICFEKPGIETANAVVILTTRWFRHMWKYRYSRSYRMVLYDVGHLLQTHILNATAVGVQSFLCPSFLDKGINELVGLEDEFDEGAIYVVGMGLKGDPNLNEYFFPEHCF